VTSASLAMPCLAAKDAARARTDGCRNPTDADESTFLERSCVEIFDSCGNQKMRIEQNIYWVHHEWEYRNS